MTIFTKLALGFATMLVTFCLVGGLSVWYLNRLRVADGDVRDRVALNEAALAYRHGAEDANLGAAQLAAGNPIGEQRISEGTRAMVASRAQLGASLTSDAARAELAELARIEKLTVAGTDRVVALVREKSTQRLIEQELAFLSARADALNLRLESLFDDTREEMKGAMALSDALGERVQHHTAIALVACVLFSALISLWVVRSIAPPLARLEAGVRKIASGNMNHHIAVGSDDEIGQLTRAFNDMTASLSRAMSALDARNQDMRLVLDHVNQGLLTVDRDGVVSRERSAMVARWLGEVPDGTTLWAHLSSLEPSFAEAFSLNFAQLVEGVLPLELTLDQLPRQLQLGAIELELDYRPIGVGEQVERLLIVLSDVSDKVARERARRHEQEVLAMFQAIQRDKAGFLEFFAEGESLVGALASSAQDSDRSLLKRQIHTLKGNAAIFGISSVAQLCHELESRLAEQPDLLDVAEPRARALEPLRARWLELEAVVVKLVGERSTRIEIGDEEYAEVLSAIAVGKPRREIARLVRLWRMERVQPRLAHFGETARMLAERLGKGALSIELAIEVTRLPRGTFAAFWGALVHAIRNAVDHGIEAGEERIRKGKPMPATLALRTRVLQDELAIEVADDGRGIDWQRIALKAQERGLPADNEKDLIQALFSDGVSTAESITDVSGRGVGMAALRDACARMAGRIVVQSVLGEGTCLSFRFPVQVMHDGTEIELQVENAQTIPPSTMGATLLPRRASLPGRHG
jgi:two-component system, chemotaxis family, sensor kinase CheA